MGSVPPARHLLRAKDLADARYFEELTVVDLARAASPDLRHDHAPDPLARGSPAVGIKRGGDH
jgi:hypothetical protein